MKLMSYPQTEIDEQCGKLLGKMMKLDIANLSPDGTIITEPKLMRKKQNSQEVEVLKYVKA
jgi:hypothetical protein